MLWTVLINPILLAVSAAVGFFGCRVAGLNPHPRELAMALVVFVIAAQIALVPLVFQRKPTVMGLTQAALVGLVLHLLVAITLALVMMLLAKANAAFVYWTLLFYWATLGGLAVVFIRAVRSGTVPRALE